MEGVNVCKWMQCSSSGWKLLKQSVMRTVALHCSTALCEQMLSRDLCHFYQHAGGRVEAGNI